jgi:inositol-1,4,5-trisphosphate 5-phosphatase
MSSEELRLFDKVRVYLDEDYSSAENFTVSMKYHNILVCVLNSLFYVLDIIFKDSFLCELLYL